jgi:uncharacterized protein YbjQ (UPF0145 family)
MHITTSSLSYNPDNFQATLVSANTVLTRNLFVDIWISIRMMFGGKIVMYSTMVEKAREQVLEELEAKAKDLKADMVVAINIETNSIHPGTIEVLAYGTALKKIHK